MVEPIRTQDPEFRKTVLAVLRDVIGSQIRTLDYVNKVVTPADKKGIIADMVDLNEHYSALSEFLRSMESE